MAEVECGVEPFFYTRNQLLNWVTFTLRVTFRTCSITYVKPTVMKSEPIRLLTVYTTEHNKNVCTFTNNMENV